MTFSTPPPPVPHTDLSFPTPSTLLITLNRPAALNAIPSPQHVALAALYEWYDNEPSLRCAILTGTGRAFCAGADLREWDEANNSGATPGEEKKRIEMPVAGFGGLSNRAGKKPVIAAVNGLCLGGGMEMVVNCDLVVASKTAKFGLPEVKRGVVALAGALPRVARVVGRMRGGEMVLLGRMYTAEQMERWGIVNWIVDEGDVVKEAIKVAEEITNNSPDAVIVSREGLRLGWEMGPERATEIVIKGLYGRIDKGEN
ncbi:hypothetical protein OQA88_13131, partial [Cercophora sp. LCS_1]